MRDQKTNRKARARLALRAESAFGLDASGMTIVVPVTRAANPQAGEESARSVIGVKGLERSSSDPLAGSQRPRPMIERPGPVPASALFSASKDEPFSATILARDARIVSLKTIDDTEVKGCLKCRLCETRTNTVFGEGDPEAKIMFVGEGPGEDEDLSGRPFVGRAGQLLDKMILGMGLKREQVYIANVVKCRPPGNRVPAPDEAGACMSYLDRQIEIVRPAVIVTLGLTAAKLLLETKSTMGKLRGTWQTWRGVKVMPTFHPAYLLRNFTEETRRAVWDDLKMVLAELNLPIPQRGK